MPTVPGFPIATARHPHPDVIPTKEGSPTQSRHPGLFSPRSTATRRGGEVALHETRNKAVTRRFAVRDPSCGRADIGVGEALMGRGNTHEGTSPSTPSLATTDVIPTKEGSPTPNSASANPALRLPPPVCQAERWRRDPEIRGARSLGRRADIGVVGAGELGAQ